MELTICGQRISAPFLSPDYFPSADDQVKRLVLATATKKLFTERHFSICQLDNICNLVGARQGGPAYTQLRSLHCVDYAAMPAELRAALPGLVNEVLLNAEQSALAAEKALQGVAIL